ncbi:MAG: RNA polymerase sigma-70 factor (ECF subfamily) [Planctomycetota bacterium]|jgi:RNA polymerase sigma-70 factor (ECF subfamily)
MADWSPDIERLQARDDAEWISVEETYCGRLLAYAQRRTGDLQASEDIVQEALLGAVRGINDFNKRFTFEQYLFGICRNRTIDHMRRQRARTIQVGEDDEGFNGLESLPAPMDTPSVIVRGRELSERARQLFGDVLIDWVGETREQNEYERLCVIEALFSGGWRNRDTWKRFGMRDETAVAGIKFRALNRLRQLAALRDPGGDLIPYLAAAEEGDQRLLSIDVQDVWQDRRVSCLPRPAIARFVAGTLERGPAAYFGFHLQDMKCPWCIANRDDLEEGGGAGKLSDVVARVSRSGQDNDGDAGDAGESN